MNVGIFILLAALILFGVLAFRQISALILAPLVSIFVIVGYRLPVLENLKNQFMPAASSYITKYFLIFFIGALFGAVYQFTGAAESIARFLSKMSGDKFVVPLVMCITGILTFGGVSGFVVFFVIYPIALQMFRKANITRMLIPAAISSGCWTWSMTAPGSPSIQNVIAMTSLGTPSTAALVPSIVATIGEFLMIFLWLEWRARKFTKRGRLFNDKSLKYQLTDEEIKENGSDDLPHPLIAFLPIVTILVSFNLIKLPVETSVLIGTVLAAVLMFRKVSSIEGWVNVFNKGAADSGVAILNTAIVVGFGGVVKNTQGFSDLIEGLKNWNVSPMLFVAITVAVCAGACGSASGGMGVAFDALTSTFVKMGINLQYVHRIGAIAAGTLDTLPHQGAQITLLGICKLTHKEAYYDIAITQILIPFLTLGIFIPLANMGL
ncbi:GntP family permease [Fusobacterium sp. IOR10]|uniref:GntP family permease n=1 Tax=Fusobacterium sp. IOR10 TaxID=2665157 RepID=UPI0013D89061|nr:Na+/H+ antiporter NhaC family protein [Fusobacterium sp. IOR10]